MITKNKTEQNQTAKILEGLKLVYQRLLAEKKAKNEEIVILRDGKIEYVRP